MPIRCVMSALVRPISSAGRGRRLGPFAVGVLGGLALVVLGTDAGGHLFAERMAAIGIAALVALASVLLPWQRLPEQLETLPAFGVLVAVGVLVADSTTPADYTPLVLLPLLWFAVYADRRPLVLAVAAADCALLAHVSFGGDPVTSGAVRLALLWVGVATFVPLGLQRFVADLRHRAALADRDYVTELLSRRAWEERLPDELARARRDGRPLSIVLIDLDEFKRYNDRYGHPAGDALLRQAAIAWSERLRSTDLLARFGGDEFCVALPGCAASDAVPRTVRLLDGMPVGVRASAGIAEWDGREGITSLVGRADEALYEAKSKRGSGARVSASGLATVISLPDASG